MRKVRQARARWQTAIIALLGLCALAFTWTGVSAQLGAPSRGANWGAIYRSHQLVVPIGPDAWRAAYNVGTGALMNEDYERAAKYLQSAYAKVPVSYDRDYEALRESPECSVRINYSLALEGQGDQAADAADAQALYRHAAQISAPCTSDGAGGGNTDEDRIHQRQRALSGQQPAPDQRQDDAPEEEPDQTADSDEPSESPSPTDRLDDRQDQLDENQRQADEQLREYQQRKERGFGHGDNW